MVIKSFRYARTEIRSWKISSANNKINDTVGEEGIYASVEIGASHPMRAEAVFRDTFVSHLNYPRILSVSV